MLQVERMVRHPVFVVPLLFSICLILAVVWLLCSLHAGYAGHADVYKGALVATRSLPELPPQDPCARPDFFPWQWDSVKHLKIAADLASRCHDVDPLLFRALINQESRWRRGAISSKKASGLTQLMPATACGECSLKLCTPQARYEPWSNLMCGAEYFSAQLNRFNSVPLALAAYNSGPNRVARLGRTPRIRETQHYVAVIIKNWKRMKK